ncbi:MAG TPA: hypothetical protein PLJ34_04855 [Hyphomicrobiales bacterium]|nr:hypothetical protein [Hyphomicrobiales bacterium]
MVYTIGAVVSVVAGVWWRIDGRIKGVERALSEYKLQVAKEYASVDHLKDVEQRLVNAVRDVSSEIHLLRGDLQRFFQKAAEKPATNR